MIKDTCVSYNNGLAGGDLCGKPPHKLVHFLQAYITMMVVLVLDTLIIIVRYDKCMARLHLEGKIQIIMNVYNVL